MDDFSARTVSIFLGVSEKVTLVGQVGWECGCDWVPGGISSSADMAGLVWYFSLPPCPPPPPSSCSRPSANQSQALKSTFGQVRCGSSL